MAGLIAALQSGEGSVDFTDVDGQSLLHAATARGVPAEIARELIRLGIDVNHQDNEGCTALQYAAVLKRADVADAILRAGGRLDIADRHGNQPLWYAVHSQHDNHDLIKLYVLHGADPHHRNIYGKSPNDLAHKVGIQELIKILGGGAPA
jgi:ankyrin repeat protein